MGKQKPKPASTEDKKPANRKPRANPTNMERFARRCAKLPTAVAMRAERRIYGLTGRNVDASRK